MSELTKKHCVPCKGGTAMTSEEAAAHLRQLPEWKLSSHESAPAIQRKFIFNNFTKARSLVDRIAEIAEHENHHPEIAFGWGYVTVTLTTHAVHGLHANDFIVAAKIDAL